MTSDRPTDGASEDRVWVDPRTYHEFREVARSHLRRESRRDDLQTTALLHEALIARSGESVPADVEERAAISATMRRLLILRARSSRTLKRGSQWRRSDADPDTLSASPRAALGEELLLIRDDLESMQSATPRVAQVARLHLFGELSLAEIARRLGVSERTAQLDWRYARAALANRLGPDR